MLKKLGEFVNRLCESQQQYRYIDFLYFIDRASRYDSW